MSLNKRFVINGVLKTVSPLHISDPSGTARFDPSLDRVIYGDKGFPLTSTRQASFFAAPTQQGAEEGEERTPHVRVPVIPATTWRGGLRRAAASVIEDHIMNTLHEKLSYEAYRGMRCGAVTGSPDKVGASTEEVLTARNHVFYGIFGGGPRMLRGNLVARDSLPITGDTLDGGYVPEAFFYFKVDVTHPSQFYSVQPVVRRDDFYKQPDAQDVVRDYESIHGAEYAEEIARSQRDKGSDKSGDVRGVQAMSFRQDVAAGLPFYVHLELHGTPAQLGLMLASLDRLLAKGIGGRASLGMGRLTGKLALTCNDEHQGEVIGVQDGQAQFTEVAQPYLESQYEAISALTLDDIERYMIPVKKEKTKP